MAVITFPGMTLTGDHSSRPAANTVGEGTLYACTTHTKIYQSDGSSWSDWFDGTAGGGSGQGLIDFDEAKYTGGDITADADGVWEDLQNALDLTLTAATGDVVEVSISCTAPNTTAVSVNLTAVSIVSASPVNDFATNTTPSDATDGVSGWRLGSSTVSNASGSILYPLQAGDISGGTVTIRFRDRPSSSTNRVVSATAAQPIHTWAKNLGQPL